MIRKIRKVLRKIFSIISFSTVLFVFQCCYGTPKDLDADVLIEGLIKTTSNNLPVSGIKVSIENHSGYSLTDKYGKFTLYSSRSNEYKIKFEDIDSISNGSLISKDSTIKFTGESVFLEITMDEK
jgi:hypothetical protein